MFISARLMTESGAVGESTSFNAGMEEIDAKVREWALPKRHEYPWDSADVHIWPNQEQANSGTAAPLNFRLVF